MSLIAKILDLLFPIECLGCAKAGQYLCPECLAKIPLNHHFICPICGHSSFLGNVCFACQPQTALDGAWLASDYKNEILKTAIKNFKYHYVADLATPLSQLLANYLNGLTNNYSVDFNPEPLGVQDYPAPHVVRGNSQNLRESTTGTPFPGSNPFNFDLIIPVPLHYRKQLLRGFNQAELLAQNLSANFAIPLNPTLLKRQKFTRSQMKLKEKKRLKNVVGAFRVIDQSKILVGKKILLIDDVLTTAATLNECAKVLKQAGAAKVWALALAKS